MTSKNNPSIRYENIAVPEEGMVVAVRPGVYWLRMPIPIPLQFINLWLLGDHKGVVLVDTGMNHDGCRSVWERLETKVRAIGPITSIVCTHWHPDHFGLAAWLQRRWGVPVWLNPADLEAASEFWEVTGDEWAALNRAFYAEHGFLPAPEFDAVLSLQEYRLGIGGIPEDVLELEADWSLKAGGRRWTAINVRGHTQGHMCLYSQADHLLISGDQLLPSISTNISVSLMRNGSDPLSQFLESLTVMGSLPPETLVLPAHGRPFVEPSIRTSQLQEHHAQVLSKAADACRLPATAADVVIHLFNRPLDGMSMILALGETLAHLRRLVTTGRLIETIDASGVHRFQDRHFLSNDRSHPGVTAPQP